MASIADFHIHGWDVSHYQAAGLNFTEGGRRFVILKASEGVGVVDANFAVNRNRAHQQGMTAVGCYHFARPKDHGAADEAAHFLAVVGPHQPGEFAVLDYEVDPWSEGWAATWLTAVKAAGWPVVFYTYHAMLAGHPHGVIKATGAALWCAAYSTKPPDTGDWPWTFWQHTDKDPWDCSVFHSNNPNDLAAFAGATPVQGDNMAHAVTYPGATGIWITTGTQKFGVATPAELDDFANAGIIAKDSNGRPAVAVLKKETIDRLDDVNVADPVTFHPDIAAIAAAVVTALHDKLG